MAKVMIQWRYGSSWLMHKLSAHRGALGVDVLLACGACLCSCAFIVLAAWSVGGASLGPPPSFGLSKRFPDCCMDGWHLRYPFAGTIWACGLGLGVFLLLAIRSIGI